MQKNLSDCLGRFVQQAAKWCVQLRQLAGKPFGFACLGLVVSALAVSSCCAQTFSKLLDQALSSDPTYMGARTAIDVADAKKRQAFGALLPQVSATANTTANKRGYQSDRDVVPEQHDSYNSNAYQLTLTQPLWRYANFVGWQQAEVIAAQAAYQFSGAEQDLFARLGNAWFDVLAARDHVLFTRMQVEAAQRFWEIAKRGEELGTHGRPQAEEARAKLDQAIADALTAETESQLKRAALEQIVGKAWIVEPPFMRDYAVLADLGPQKLDEWLTRTEENNPNILSASKAFEAASDEVRKQSAGHHPTLDVVVNYGNNAQAVGGFPGQAGYAIRQGSIGLQLNVPIFSGGTQSAKTDEAIAQKEKARFDLEAARRTAVLATKQAWFNWHSARAREQAGAQGVRSAKTAMDVARVGLENGLKTEWDFLQAGQQWRTAIRDFRKGRYDQAVSYVKLKASSGSLTVADLQAFDALFVGSEDEALGESAGESSSDGRPTVSRQESTNTSGAGVARVKSSRAEGRATALALEPLEKIRTNGSAQVRPIDMRADPVVSIGWPL